MNFEQAYAIWSPVWDAPKRFYHNRKNHLDPMLLKCTTIEQKYFALFHDIVYNPYSKTNELESAEAFKSNSNQFEDISCFGAEVVYKMILATRTHESNDPIVQEALRLDLEIMDADFNTILDWERGIFLEFQSTEISAYVYARTKFLEKYIDKPNIALLISYINKKTYKIGIYVGSFDPFHIGHLDVLRQAEKVFDKVVIARCVNPGKFAASYLKPSSLPNEWIEHKGLVTDLLHDAKNEYTIIRGLRNSSDVQSEINYTEWVKELKPDVKFVHFFCDRKNEKMSSSAIKALIKSGVMDVSKWVVK